VKKIKRARDLIQSRLAFMRNTIENQNSQSAIHIHRTGNNIHSRKGGKNNSIDLAGSLVEDIDEVIDIKYIQDKNIVVQELPGEYGDHSDISKSTRRNISSVSVTESQIDDENSPSKGLNKANRRSASSIICSTMSSSLVLVSQRIWRAVCRIECMNSTRLVVLIVLSLQNSLFTVLRRYSQGILKEKYSTYECLLLGEIIKIIFSAYMIRSQLDTEQQKQRDVKRVETSSLLSTPGSTDSSQTFEETRTASIGNEFTDGSVYDRKQLDAVFSERIRFVISTSGKMFGLALIYGAMNILSFVSLKNIGAGMFTIFAQCKILTTATFSCWILGRQYSYTKWRALAALMAGVLLFSEPIWSKKDAFKSSNDNANTFIGTAAVITEVTLSGFASIYFEKVVKLDPLPLSIWERNFQLALVSVHLSAWSSF
jgi:Nucleotide-sugar transporter